MIRVEVRMPGARLTVEQRRTIERCYRIGLSQEQIASIIGKHKSTVSRELGRSFSAPGSRSPKRSTARGGGRGYQRVYDAERAHRYAEVRGRRPKGRRLDHPRLREKVWELLRADWSPEQIAASLPGLYPRNPRMWVSHETIYQSLYRSLFVQTRGELKRELTAHLRSRRQARKPQTGGAKRVTLGITDDIRISARPAEAEDRAVPGHWEGDLLLGGTGKGAVITLVERSSRFLLLAPLPGRHTAETARMTLAEMIATLPPGTAQVDHLGSRIRDGPARFKIDTGVQIYFCDPQSPWQRGSLDQRLVATASWVRPCTPPTLLLLFELLSCISA